MCQQNVQFLTENNILCIFHLGNRFFYNNFPYFFILFKISNDYRAVQINWSIASKISFKYSKNIKVFEGFLFFAKWL
jgi:hypothetical protein